MIWAWKTKIVKVLNVYRRLISSFSGSLEELVVCIDVLVLASTWFWPPNRHSSRIAESPNRTGAHFGKIRNRRIARRYPAILRDSNIPVTGQDLTGSGFAGQHSPLFAARQDWQRCALARTRTTGPAGRTVPWPGQELSRETCLLTAAVGSVTWVQSESIPI
jgi:hypothetical protein